MPFHRNGWRRIKPKGEGLEMQHRLATSPRTADFISLKLAQRFVSDDPPPGFGVPQACCWVRRSFKEDRDVAWHISLAEEKTKQANL